MGIVLLIDLQARWNPNIKDSDVDNCHKNSGANHDGAGSPSVWYDDANTVDDNLKQELNLDAPKEDCRKVSPLYLSQPPSFDIRGQPTNGEIESETWASSACIRGGSRCEFTRSDHLQ